MPTTASQRCRHQGRPLKRLRLLIFFGGTSEASALARRIAGDAGAEAILSLAGATANPAPGADPGEDRRLAAPWALRPISLKSASMR